MSPTLVHAGRAGHRRPGMCPRCMMCDMSKDRPEADDAASAAAAVPEMLTFGDEERPARPALRWLAGLRDDRRIAPVAAGLGAVALVVSLLAEWQVTSVHQGLFGGDEEAATRSLTTGVGDLGGWTGCYLAGLFVLVGVVTLLLFGPWPGRAYARLVALSTGAVLAVVLLTLS